MSNGNKSIHIVDDKKRDFSSITSTKIKFQIEMSNANRSIHIVDDKREISHRLLLLKSNHFTILLRI